MSTLNLAYEIGGRAIFVRLNGRRCLYEFVLQKKYTFLKKIVIDTFQLVVSRRRRVISPLNLYLCACTSSC